MPVQNYFGPALKVFTRVYQIHPNKSKTMPLPMLSRMGFASTLGGVGVSGTFGGFGGGGLMAFGAKKA